MIISLIAAVGKNKELGKDNKLIWTIPDDLKYFKEKTLNKTIVMGSATFKSIGKALSNRKNIVLTTKKIELENVTIINDYEDILKLKEEEIFVIGGEKIYKLFLPLADNIYLTEIEEECKDADTYFPEFDKNLFEKEIIESKEYENTKYSFTRYRKK